MGRYSANPSYGHRVQRLGHDYYRLHWTQGRHYPDSRLRHPFTNSRDTDEAGARKFCEKWQIPFPEED